MIDILVFIISFAVPIFYYRIMAIVYLSYFNISSLRKKTGLQIHHIHYGIFWILVSAFMLILFGKSSYVIVLLGFGLGLVMDEFVPSLLMPWDRKKEMEAYRKGFYWTLVLFAFISLLLILLYYLF